MTTRVPSAALLAADELSDAVQARYREIDRALTRLQKRALRIWNYVPRIEEPLGPALDRYMAFNRGRHAVYARAARAGARFDQVVPAASAVGVTGPDLVIDCLATSLEATPVENPRQTASWRYSRRYGPQPPCFARGMVTSFGDRTMLLLAGTASIVGEESMHPGNGRAQVLETLRNIEALIVNAGAVAAEPLQLLTDVRIYVVHADDIEIVEAELRARSASGLRIEAAQARLCRPELLVEIEGLAVLA